MVFLPTTEQGLYWDQMEVWTDMEKLKNRGQIGALSEKSQESGQYLT